MIREQDVGQRCPEGDDLVTAERVESAFDEAAIGFAILSLDERFLRVNRRWSEITGYDPDEIGDLTAKLLRAPDDAGTTGPSFEDLAPPIDGRPRFVQRYRHKAGHTVPVTVQRTVIADRAGRPMHYVEVIDDVTEKASTERALRRAEEEFRLTFEQAPIGMALVSTGGSFLAVNKALGVITGFDRDELLKLTFQDITHPDDLAADLSLVDQVLAGQIPHYSMAKRYIHKRGHVVDIMLHVSLVRDERGRPFHFVSHVEDITERRQVQARLIQSERLAALGTLAGGVAHEVNNPLACIMSSMETLREARRASLSLCAPVTPEVDVDGVIDDAQRAAARIHKIVSALRTFARGDVRSPSVVDVQDVLDTTASLLCGEIQGRAQVVRDYGAVPKVRADEARLAQLFMNLIVNAAHSIPPGAPQEHEIRIATRTDAQGDALIEIRDTGPGISAPDMGRLFEPFFTTKPFGKGSGLGLAVAHGIVKALGGEIVAENGIGSGASLKVTLPAA